MPQITLGLNVDHIATLRQVRGVSYPDPLEGAAIALENGASCITMHLREDRRHIQDRDVLLIKERLSCKFNLEMALNDDVICVARKVLPNQVTLVPEKRQELTTEGGLDVRKNLSAIKDFVAEFQGNNIPVSLFIEPDNDVIDATLEVRCIVH